MSKRENNIPSALKHGAYSGTTLLPGEDPAAFKKLHNDLVVDLAPTGPLEEEIVVSIARLVWRKKNLLTYRLASEANAIRSIIMSSVNKENNIENFPNTPMEQAFLERYRAALEKVEKELGAATELVRIGKVATTDYLLNELSVVDRLDGMIDRCLKRLLFVKGLKSISSLATEKPAPSPKSIAAS